MNLRTCFPLLIAAALLPLGAQQAKPKSPRKGKPKPTPVQAAPAPEPPPTPPAPEPPPAPKPKPRVRLVTSYGPVVVELEPDLAPLTVENFLNYVKAGHYNGTIFHRVMRGFMVQGGGFTEAMDEKPTQATIRNEAPATFKAGLKNTRGTVAMARMTEPHTASAQFYFNLVDNPSLDHKATTEDGYGYCVFGKVVEGMDAVDKIALVRTGLRKGMEAVPDYPVRIKSAEVLPKP